jgi:hypothetical protein
MNETMSSRDGAIPELRAECTSRAENIVERAEPFLETRELAAFVSRLVKVNGGRSLSPDLVRWF